MEPNDTATAGPPSTESKAGGFVALLCRHWAIVPGALRELTASLAGGHVEASAIIAAGGEPSEADMAPVAASGRRASAGTRVASSGTEIAVLPLRGTIRPRGSWLSQLFGGGGGLLDFRESFREALADPNVSAIVLDIDSPGGLIDLVPETAAEIRAGRDIKTVVAVSNTLCASAAYWIGSQASEFVVTPSGQVGSVGVFCVHEDFSRMEDMMGISTTIISAGDYKTDGNPYEPLSNTARAAIQDQVDQLYAMFTGDVAAGRGVKQQAVAAGYGSGRLLLASDALAVGMVDRIETLEDTLARLGGTPMDDDDDATDGGMDDNADPDNGPMATIPAPSTDVRATVTPRPMTDYLSPTSALREQSYL